MPPGTLVTNRTATAALIDRRVVMEDAVIDRQRCAALDTVIVDSATGAAPARLKLMVLSLIVRVALPDQPLL